MNRAILLILTLVSVAWVSGTQPPPPWVKQEGPSQSSQPQSSSSGTVQAPPTQNADGISAATMIAMYQEQIDAGEAKLRDIDAQINDVQQQITAAEQNYENILAQEESKMAQSSSPPSSLSPDKIEPGKDPASAMTIIKAMYGAGDDLQDITKRIQALVVNNRFGPMLARDICHCDPAFGRVKKTTVVYIYDGRQMEREFGENESINLP